MTSFGNTTITAALTVGMMLAGALTMTSHGETVETSRGTVTVLFTEDSTVAALPDKVTGKYYTYAHDTGSERAVVKIYPKQDEQLESGFKREPADVRALLATPEKLALIFFESSLREPLTVTTAPQKVEEEKKKKPPVTSSSTKKPPVPKTNYEHYWNESSKDPIRVETSKGPVVVVFLPTRVVATLTLTKNAKDGGLFAQMLAAAGTRLQYIQFKGSPQAWVSKLTFPFTDIDDGWRRAPVDLLALLKSPEQLLEVFNENAGTRDEKRLDGRVTGGITLHGTPRQTGNVWQWHNARIEKVPLKAHNWKLFNQAGQLVAETDAEKPVIDPHTGEPLRSYEMTVYAPATRKVLRCHTVCLALPLTVDTVFRIPCGEILHSAGGDPRQDFPGMMQGEMDTKYLRAAEEEREIINQGQRAKQTGKAIVQDIANFAAQQNDAEMLDLLGQHGITVNGSDGKPLNKATGTVSVSIVKTGNAEVDDAKQAMANLEKFVKDLMDAADRGNSAAKAVVDKYQIKRGK